MQEKINFYQVRSIGEIVNATLEFIKQNFKGLMKSVLFIAGPSIFIAAIAYGIFQSRLLGLMSAAGSNDPQVLRSSFSLIYSSASWMTFFYLLTLFVLFAVVYEYIRIYASDDNKEITVGAVWSGIKKDLWMILKTIIGIFITMIVICIIFFLVMILIGALIGVFGAMLASIGGIVGVILQFVFSFSVAIGIMAMMLYVFCPLCLIFSVRIMERRRFLDTISRTYNLIRGRRWKTVGLILLTFAIQFSLSFVFNIPGWVINVYKSQTTSILDFSTILIVMGVLMILFSYVVSVIFITALNFHYFSLVEEKESVGMMKKVSSFGAGPVAEKKDEEAY